MQEAHGRSPASHEIGYLVEPRVLYHSFQFSLRAARLGHYAVGHAHDPALDGGTGS